MGDHDTPVVGVRVLGSLDGLGEGTDLVDLEQKSIARLELNSLLDTQGVGNGQVITVREEASLDIASTEICAPWQEGHLPNNLEVRGLVEVAPGLPVVLSEGVLNADNRILGSQ